MYLEGSDHNGVVLTVPGNKDALVFVHTESCPYCVRAKPVFEEFCKLYPEIDCFMVDVDDVRGKAFLEKQRLMISSVPTFLRYSGGYLVPGDLKDRTVEGMHYYMMA